MTECSHCSDTNSCDCILCGSSKLSDGVTTWTPGPCVRCKGRAFHQRHRSILEAHDTMDRKNWEYHPGADGNKGYRIFIPLKGLQ